MNISKQIKDFPDINEQLRRIKSDLPIPNINIESIGKIGCLLISAESAKWKKVIRPEPSFQNRPYWQILHPNNEWLFVEDYVSQIFKSLDFKTVDFYTRDVYAWMWIPEPEPFKFWGRQKRFALTATFDTFWTKENNYFEKKFQRSMDTVLHDKKADGTDFEEGLKKFVKTCPIDKIKKLIYYTHIINNSLSGVPDLFLYNEPKNKYLFCEVKSESDNLSLWQKNFINWQNESNGIPVILSIILQGDYPQWDIKNAAEEYAKPEIIKSESISNNTIIPFKSEPSSKHMWDSFKNLFKR